MFDPKLVNQAITIARLHEATLESTTQSLHSVSKPQSSSFIRSKVSTIAAGAPKPLHKLIIPYPTSFMSQKFPPVTSTIPGSVVPIKRLTPIEMHARCEKSLCYNYDGVYSFGCRCKCKQLFILAPEVEDLDESVQATESVNPPECGTEPTSSTSNIAISLNALSGNVSFQTLKL